MNAKYATVLMKRTAGRAQSKGVMNLGDRRPPLETRIFKLEIAETLSEG